MNQLPNPGRCRRSAIQLVAVEARWRRDGHRRNPHRVGRNRLCWSITRARPRRCLLGCLDGNGCSAPVTAATIERSRLCDHYSMRSYCSALQRSSARMPPRIRLERTPICPISNLDTVPVGRGPFLRISGAMGNGTPTAASGISFSMQPSANTSP
jgi:hypothetical protein